MSIWNLPVRQEKSATPTGNAGIPAGAGRHGFTLTDEIGLRGPICVDCAAPLAAGQEHGESCDSCAALPLRLDGSRIRALLGATAERELRADAPREACADCECELEVDGSCLNCLAADEAAARVEAAHLLAPGIVNALADVIENGGSFADAVELAFREAGGTEATRAANRLERSGVHVRAGVVELKVNVGGLVFTVKVSS